MKGREQQGATLPSHISDSPSRVPALSEGLGKCKASFCNFKEDDFDVDDKGSEEDEESIAEEHNSHFPLPNPGEARSSKEAAVSKQKTDPLLTSLEGLPTGPQASLAPTSETLHAATLLQILKDFRKSQ